MRAEQGRPGTEASIKAKIPAHFGQVVVEYDGSSCGLAVLVALPLCLQSVQILSYRVPHQERTVLEYWPLLRTLHVYTCFNER